MRGLRAIATALEAGQTSSVELVEDALTRARQSQAVFTSINEGLPDLAASIDATRSKGNSNTPLAGIPIALKDLFNLRNETTLAGSVVRRHYAQPEAADADVVAPLRAAGLLFLGRTNMSEFAFSGIGRNPHYGTPLSIWDRTTGRLPGGSSSGSAVAVAEGIVCATLGSDTAGSCRIPAAFNGVVGVKPSFGRMSLNGIFPLSPTLDAPGPIAADVDSCYILDRLMCGASQPAGDLPRLSALEPHRIRLAIPDSRVMQQLDAEVEDSFNTAIDALATAGVGICRIAMPVLDQCDDFFIQRPVVVREVWDFHRHMLEQHPDEYDPFVGLRMSAGSAIDDAEQASRYAERSRLVDAFESAYADAQVDALVYPTVACVPPPISDTEDAEQARQVNLRCLRNTATVNYFNGCAISLPCHGQNEAPVGLMLAAANGNDENLYRIAATAESLLPR